MEETMRTPPWLEPLLNASFFSVCQTHSEAARIECNMYCLDCNVDPFCFYCRSSEHKDHQVIQIRRLAYRDVVRVSEIQKLLDISGVQRHVINRAKVVFLKQRRQPKNNGKAVSHVCETCGGSLLVPFRFCSLECKLAGIKRNGNSSIALDAKNEEVLQRGEGISTRMAVETSRREEELLEGSRNDISTPTPSSNARRRKGIPRRAPLF